MTTTANTRPQPPASPGGPAAPAPAATPPRSSSLGRWAEIRLVAGRELRTQAMRRSTVVSTVLLLVLVVGGILAYAHLSGGETGPYRVAVVGPGRLAGLDQVTDSSGQAVTIVDLEGTDPRTALGEDAPEAVRADMVVETTGDSPRLIVAEEADEAVAAGVTSVLQQQALAQQVTGLGGDPAEVGSALVQASPEVVALNPPETDAESFRARYAVLLAMDLLLFVVMMTGGQRIAMGVVEEKGSRIVEILLACVRPTSLLAGKVLGIGTWLLLTTALLGGTAVVTAQVTDVIPQTSVDLDTTFVVMLVWTLVGYATFSVLFGAAASLVSRQEDVGSVTAPLGMLLGLPYVMAFTMAFDPHATVYQVMSYVPVLSPFLMPARLALGVSGWAEQAVALAIALAVLPVLIMVAARVYTRAVTRTGARVPLREVLGRGHVR